MKPNASRRYAFNTSMTLSITVVMTLVVMLLLISACGPAMQASALSESAAPEIAPTALVGHDTSLRYVLMPNTVNAVPDLQLLKSASDVVQLTDETAAIPAYDIAVKYGLEAGWTASAYTPMVSLVMDGNNSLFEDAAVMDALLHAINAQAVTQQLVINGAQAMTTAAREPNFQRVSLSDEALPDGVVLSFGVGYVPGASLVIDQLEATNLKVQSSLLYTNEIREALIDGSIQAALVFWTLPIERDGWVQRYGAENVVDLYSVPISYKVNPNWSVNLTPNGFPLVMFASDTRRFDTVEMNTSSGG